MSFLNDYSLFNPLFNFPTTNNFKMLSLAQKLTIVTALVAYVEARFGQEQEPVAAVQALQFGAPGEAATLAGQIPSSLLAAASPCDKLALADQIAALGDDPSVLSAAIGLVAAETNFNPFAVDRPFVCADPSLPATEALRGITPLVDPAVTDADIANAASAQSVGTPFNADGLSQAEVMIAQGFTTFQAVDGSGANIDLAGQDGGAAGGAGGGAAGGADNAGNDNAADDAGNDAGNDNAGGNGGNGNANNGCNGNAGNNNGNAGNDNAGDNAGNDNAGGNAGNDNADDNAGDDNAGDDAGNDAGNDNAGDDAGNDAGAGNGGDGNADFGDCVPTMDFVGGRNGRAADEFTFLPTDPLVAEGQQEALNPNIITNRICDQLTNVCNANDAAKALCEATQAQIEALGTRDQTTADTWNAALGF